jgi:hypothetical protein
MKEKIHRTYRGITYYGTQEEINKLIESREIEENTIYKSSVYTYSCKAVKQPNGEIKLIEYFNNGQKKEESIFKNEQDFWKSKTYQ